MLEASNPDEVVSILQGRELVVISVTEHRSDPARLGGKRRTHGSVTTQDLAIFARSLAAMAEAGLPLLRALEIVGEQARSRKLGRAITEMARDIRGGSTFRDAMAKHGSIFSPFWISLIETGEASGQLTRVLNQISIHLEKSGAVRRKVISALVYPAILVVAAAGAIMIFTLKIIPTFAALFSSVGSELPALTRAVIGFSAFMRHNFIFLVLGGLVAWFLLTGYLRTPQGRWQFDTLKLRLPVLGGLFQGIAAEEFASNLGTLLKAGVPILHAMEIVIATSGNKVVASVLEHMQSAVREGRPLADPLSKTDLFPPMLAQMVAVGEQTGKLPPMLEEVARYYEEQIATMTERMTTLLEPVILIGMGLLVGVLVISMYLPIFQMSQTFGK